MKLFKSLLLISLCFASQLALSSEGQEVEYVQYQVVAHIDALDYADYHDSTNEYKVAFDLQSKEDNYMLGTLKGSSAENIYSYFTDYTRVKVGNSLEVRATLTLPKNLISQIQMRFMIIEADFSIPVPGPCCIVINDDDRIATDTFDIANNEWSVYSQSNTTAVRLSLHQVDQGFMSAQKLRSIVDGEILKGSFFSYGKTHKERLLKLLDKSL